MSADSETFRGFVQHRRTNNSAANGTGLPRPEDILEGEIAINLATRQIFTKRNRDSDSRVGSSTVSTIVPDVGYKTKFFRRTNLEDSEILFWGTTRSIAVTAVSGSELATAFDAAVASDSGLTSTPSGDTLYTYQETAAADSDLLTVDLRSKVDFTTTPIHRVNMSSSLAGAALTVGDEIVFYTASGDILAVTSGTVVEEAGTALYISDLTSNPVNVDLTGLALYERNPTNSEEIVLLNNIPSARAEFPSDPSFGDIAILTEPGREGLYWYDNSRVNDDDVQAKIRSDIAAAADVEALLDSRNLVRVSGDSDGDPNARFAEWRSFVSPQLIETGPTIIEGDLVYQDKVVFEGGVSFDDGDSNLSLDFERGSTVGTNNWSRIGNDPAFYIFDSDGNVVDQFVTRNNLLAMNDDIGDSGFLRRGGQNTITGTITPNANDSYDFGSSGNRFNTIHATTFEGTATQARYADLAEKYLADQEYEVGIVVAIGGEAEVTAASYETAHSVLGVVSENPAFKMNSDLENGTYIALKGRVPVKIVGMVQKGDRLTASSNNGFAEANNANGVFAFAIALEDSAGDVVEAVIL